MAAGPRVTLLPVNFNQTPNGNTWLTAASAGYDTGSPGGVITAWSTTLGVRFANNGQMVLVYACGATLAGATQVLVGSALSAGGAQVLPATTLQYTIAANSTGWLGPWSPQLMNQQQPANVTYSGAINTTALGAAEQGTVVIDFTTTTTLAVRLMQLVPQIP